MTHCFSIAFPNNPYNDAIVLISISQLLGGLLINHVIPMLPTPSPYGLHIL